VFSNHAREDTHLSAVQEACRRAGLPLDVVGAGAGRSMARPGAVIGDYDLVFAKAKSALEALAVGAAVVLCDHRGLGPMVTAAGFEELRRLNLGLRTLSRPLDPGLILREIERYNARDAAEVSRRVREEAGLEPALDRLVALYEEVIGEHERQGPCDPEEESRAASAYLRAWAGWNPPLREPAAVLERRVAVLEDELRAVRLERDRLERTLHAVSGTITWRLRERLMKVPGLWAASRTLRRLRRDGDQRR
jgi:hypothetical protein